MIYRRGRKQLYAAKRRHEYSDVRVGAGGDQDSKAIRLSCIAATAIFSLALARAILTMLATEIAKPSVVLPHSTILPLIIFDNA